MGSGEDGCCLREQEVMILNEIPVVMVLVRMAGGSLMIWIGDRNGQKRINNLALALSTNATVILNQDDMFSQGLAKKLSVKHNNGKPVYVSFNCQNLSYRNDDFQLAVQKSVTDFLKSSSE